MLSRIDDIIYPNRCEVIEFTDPQRFVYPIYKNGSTSLIEHAKQQGYKTLLNEQIKKITTVDIILRDPKNRFVSGLNTFVYNTKKDNPNLDINTIVYFAENYLFLNRHYAPQMSWILNLKKYLNSECKLRLHNMTSLMSFTPLNINPIESNLLTDDIIQRLRNNIYAEMYMRLDSLLFHLVGKEITFNNLMSYLQSEDSIAYLKLKCIALD